MTNKGKYRLIGILVPYTIFAFATLNPLWIFGVGANDAFLARLAAGLFAVAGWLGGGQYYEGFVRGKDK